MITIQFDSNVLWPLVGGITVLSVLWLRNVVAWEG